MQRKLQTQMLDELKALLNPTTHPQWRVEMAAERLEAFIRQSCGGPSISLIAKGHLNNGRGRTQ